jgi:phosphoribosyl-ATP pyrophosphohydrolase
MKTGPKDGEISADVLERLFAVIDARRGADSSESYTAQLLAEGTDRIAQKLGEEAVETVIAGTKGDRAAVISESADLLYHLLVLWAASGIAPGEVWGELARREGRSGLDEKKSRSR